MSAVYATVADLTELWRELTPEETQRAQALLPVISAALRQEAKRRGRDLDAMIGQDPDLAEVTRSVAVDVAARTLMTATDGEPVSQASESAPDYSWSATYLVPGGGLFIKSAELARLGLKRQRYGALNLYETPEVS